MTWPMRHSTMYAAPFRILHATDMVGMRDGPLYGQIPGGITRWMAVPWQADTASCRSGYPTPAGVPPVYAPHLPTFWPARVPNQVLSRADYDVVINTRKPLGERLKAFANRSDWLAPIKTSSDPLDQINSFIANISQMGVVEVQDGPKNDPHFPALMEVEDLSPPARQKAAARAVKRTDLSHFDKLRRFPYGLKQLV
jgi:hypothetical protein